jgi:hypothetical protein
LGWLNINGITSSTPLTWADRGDPDRGVQSLSVIDTQWGRHAVPGFKNLLGYPYEWLIELCNETGKDLWIQVPHTATADLHTHLAQLVQGSLRRDLRCWIECSNEIWNSAVVPTPAHAGGYPGCGALWRASSLAHL